MKAEKPQTLADLQDENDKFRLIFENALEGVAVTQNGRVVFSNPALRAMLGVTKQAFLDHDVFSFTHPSETRRAKANYAARLRGEHAPERIEYRMRDREGEEVWVELAPSRILWEGSPAIMTFASDISARKKAQRLAEALDASNDGVWRLNLTTGAFQYSKRWGEIHGYAPGETIDYAKLLKENLHPEDAEAVHSVWDRFLAGSIPAYELEFRLRGKDGRYRWLYSRLKVVSRDENGAPECVIGVHTDISGRRYAQEENRRLKERLQGLFDHLAIGVAVYEAVDDGQDFRFLDFNKAAESFDNITSDKVLGRTLTETFPNVISTGLLEALRSVWRTGKPIHIPAFYYEDDLRRGWRENRIFRIPSGEVAALFEDVTPRVEAQEALRQSESDLRRAQRLARIGAWNYDIASGKVVWSGELYEIYGYVPGEIEPSYAFTVDVILHPDNKDALDGLLARFSGGVREATFTGKIIRKDGAVRWMKSFAELETGEDGRPKRLLGASQDVTSIMMAEQALQAAKERAEEANRVKTSFLANMSHEIRTPLNGVMGMLQLLLMGDLDAEQREIAEASLSACARLERLLSDILDVSSMEAGGMRISEEPFALIEIMDSLGKLFAPAAAKAGLEIELVTSPDIPPLLLGDGGRVRQILNNLVGNAVKYSSKGVVRVSAQRLEGSPPHRAAILFTVSDQGNGIAPQDMKRIFEPFTQADLGYSRRHQGAGLGLSIVKRLVQRMGGSVDAYSEQGFGSEFNVRLDFKTYADLPAGDAPSLPAGGIPPGLRILLAEDDEISQKATVLLLERFGASCAVAGTGGQALDLLRKEHFDLILMDVQMPEMNGMEATKAIRDGQAGADKTRIPIAALTAYAMDGDRERFLAAGMDAYAPKPLKLENLLRTIRAALGLESARQGARA